MPPSVQATFQAPRRAFLNSLANEPILILAAVVTFTSSRRFVRELHPPITIISTLHAAGVGAILALLICRHGFQRYPRSSE